MDKEPKNIHLGLLLWTLWHHQGSQSPVGQPIRRALVIDPHAAMTAEQIREGGEAVRLVMEQSQK